MMGKEESRHKIITSRSTCSGRITFEKEDFSDIFTLTAYVKMHSRVKGCCQARQTSSLSDIEVPRNSFLQPRQGTLTMLIVNCFKTYRDKKETRTNQ